MTQPAFQQGRYEVRYELRRDACGILLLAIDSKIAHREVLIRRISDTASVPLMQRIAQLSHPTLPPVYDFFEEQGNRYLVLEHPAGQTLADIVLGPPLKEQVVVAWGRQIAAGLTYLHQQRPPLVHGDLRPAVLVLQEGRQIKLTGGLPSGCANLPPTRYSAPERWNGAPPDALSDQYAFAATLHHLITGVDPNGQPLHTWVHPQSRRPEVSDQFSATLLRALSEEPAQRWGSIDAMIQSLVASAATRVAPVIPRPVTPPPVSQPVPQPARPQEATLPFDQLQHAHNPAQAATPEPPRPLPRRPRTEDYEPHDDRAGNWGALALGMLLAFVVLGGVGWFIWNSLDTSTPAPLTGTLSTVAPATITRDEGAPIVAADLTATSLALFPPVVNTPTIGPDQATAEAELTALASTATTQLNQAESFYITGRAFEDAGQLVEALEQYSRVLEFDPAYKDTPQRIADLQARLAATSTAIAEAAQPTAAATLEVPTITSEPSQTPTLVPPSPTPEGALIADSFDADTVGDAWSTRPGDGTITVEDGALVLSGDTANCYPLVQFLPAEPVEADFDLVINFQYREVTGLGSGFILASEPAETCGPTDRSGSYWFGIWQDAQIGLVADFHRDFDPERGPEQDLREPLSAGAVDTAEHAFRVERRAGIDRFFLDDEFIFEARAGDPLQALWFGNPTRSADAGRWTSFEIRDVLWQSIP